jgi:hypothetical protein
VNVESLIDLFGRIPDGGDLYAKVIRDRWLDFAQCELNAYHDLRRRNAALAQHPRGAGDRVLVQFDCHRNKAALWIRCDVYGHYARGHEPFGFDGENAIGG